MRSIMLSIPPKGLDLRLSVRGSGDSQIVLVLPDEVELSETRISEPEHTSVAERSRTYTLVRAPVTPIAAPNGFPPRKLTEETIVQILQENGGPLHIRDDATQWNIYDEIAARLGVSIDARRRTTKGTGEFAWRPEVGFARKNLEQCGIVRPTEESGRGVWALADRTPMTRG